MGAAGSSLELPVERDDLKPYVEKLTKLQAKLESGEAWTADERDAMRDAVERSRDVYAKLIEQAPAHRVVLQKLRANLLTKFSEINTIVYSY